MLTLSMVSALTILLCLVYTTTWYRYRLTLALADVIQSGRFSYRYLLDRYQESHANVRVYTHAQLPSELKRLRALSDVILMQPSNHTSAVAYYIAKTSWKDAFGSVTALFEKPLQGQRQEIVPYVTQLRIQPGEPAEFALVVRSHMPVQRQPSRQVLIFRKYHTHSDRFLRRVWYGVL